MRTDDPRRETVVASVREQVALVGEIAKATFAEICELSKPKVAERVFELLREGQIGSIEQFRQEVEGLGQRKANSLMEQDIGNEAAQGKTSRISMPSHQQYYETMRREEFEPRRGTRQSSATEEPIEFSLGDHIRTMSLPEVQPFCGRPGECFKRYSCTIQEKTFKDVVPDAPEAIANLRFDTIFGLARLLSIYEHERNEERKRFLMLDYKYCSISVTGAQKAFLFYKKFCDHVFRSLILHDGSSLCLPHDGGTGWPIEQLNQATNEAVRYAQANSWDEVNVKEPNMTLLILPDSFRAITAAFRENAYVERRLYSKLSEVSSWRDQSPGSVCW
nr:unnamed protein product [Haemonchus contortus]